MNLENRRMALLLEEAQRLMAERDPAALIRHVCTAARPLTQASYVGVGVVDDDGAIDEFVAVGLDETVVAKLRQSLTPITIILRVPPSSPVRSFAV